MNPEKPDVDVEPGEIKKLPDGSVVIGAPTATAAASAPPPDGEEQKEDDE